MINHFERIHTIISGGQTGADMGGLLAARELGLKTGGFAPKGYKTENGPNLALKEFGLKPTLSPGYKMRTMENVHMASGTVIFGRESSGSLMTLDYCRTKRRPWIWLEPDNEKDGGVFLRWLWRNPIYILNVAGNRESTNPGIQDRVVSFLTHCARLQ